MAPELVKAAKAAARQDFQPLKSILKVWGCSSLAVGGPVGDPRSEPATALRAAEMPPCNVQEEAHGIYSFDMFQPMFCRMFLEELDNYYASGLPIRRPNSMNNYGIIVNEVLIRSAETLRAPSPGGLVLQCVLACAPGQIGLRGMMTLLQRQYLWPVAKLLFPREGEEFHDHHSFMVQYKQVRSWGRRRGLRGLSLRSPGGGLCRVRTWASTCTRTTRT